ncbi:MAG TPA: DMT family transporter, partial [Bacillota bacterium]
MTDAGMFAGWGALPALAALAGRIVLLGVERVVVKQLGSQRGSVEATLLFFGLGSLFLAPFAPEAVRRAPALLPVLPTGVVYTVGFVLYVRALSRGQVSLVAPLASFNVVFLALLAIPLAGERVDAARGAGLLLLFAGTALLEGGRDLLRGWRRVWSQPGAGDMVVSALLIAAGRVVDKRLSVDLPALSYAWAIYTVVSLALLGYLALRGRVAAAGALLRERPAPALVSGFINAYAYVLLLAAIRTLDVSVVEPASNLSMLLAVLLGGWVYREPVAR